jgi:hypothetical protein
MGSVEGVSLYIHGSNAGRVPIILPETDPNEPISVNTTVRAEVTLSADDIDEIGKNGTYYDLRIRLYEEDNSI